MLRHLFKKLRRSLMGPIQLTTAFWERAQGQGSRSTVLRPLGWLLALCATGSLGSVSVSAPVWLTVLFAVGAGLSILIYLAAYGYCLLKSPEALRTESYSIQKLAIEKSFRGDSLTGVVTIAGEQKSAQLLEPQDGEESQ
jgi:hypothetical protein